MSARHRAEPVRRTHLLPTLQEMLPNRRLRIVGGVVGAVGVLTLTAAAHPFQEAPTAQLGAVPDVLPQSLLDGRDYAGASRSVERSPIVQTAARPPQVRSAPELGAPEVVAQQWTTDAVNVRSGATADSEAVTTLAAGSAVDVTAAVFGDWRQVVVEGQSAWVHSGFLTEEEPVAQEPAAQDAATGSGGQGEAAQGQTAQAAPQQQSPSTADCPISSGVEASLQANATAAYRAVCAAFPGAVSAYGGYRAGDSGDHGSGRALDIMVSGAIGWEIASYLQSRSGELGITYLIYEQKIWMAGDPFGAWEGMADRGGATANHWDHVHVSTR